MTGPTDTHWGDGLPRMSSVYPDGVSHGRASIVHRTASPQDASLTGIRLMQSGRGSVRAGETYAELRIGGSLWMSDTRDERRDHMWIVHKAKGDVLIAGLGLGMVAIACAEKSSVSSVTVIEMNADVTALTEPHIRRRLGARADVLRIIEANALTWSPPKGAMFDTMWWDIWLNLCTDDLAEHAALNRRFARRLRPGGYRGAWGSELLQSRRRHDQREARWSSMWRRHA